MINRIIFRNSYLSKIVGDTNNSLTIFIKAIVCYVKYFLFSILFSLVILFGVVFIASIVSVFGSQSLTEYIAIAQRRYLLIFVLLVFTIVFIFIFRKLIFVEHLLTQKNITYKMKELCKESYRIATFKKYYILGFYWIINIFSNIPTFRVLFFVFNILNIKIGYIDFIVGIVNLILYCVYTIIMLIYYADVIEKNKENLFEKGVLHITTVPVAQPKK